MACFKLEEIIAVVGGRLSGGDPQLTVSGICTDSRQVKRGDLFLALKGERFDGHQFLNEAVKAGAAALLVMEDTGFDYGAPVIRTGDTLKALGAIARWHREKFMIPVIGITGSNGKTTTKDLTASVLAAKFRVVKTEANYNNEIGLPLTLLRIDPQTEAVVVEMGMRGLGQIQELASIAEPEIGVLTNIGQAHLELLGSEANIAKAKYELIEALPENGIAVINGDDPWMRRMPTPSRVTVFRYGLDHPGLDYRASIIKTLESGTLIKVTGGGEEFEVRTPLPGRFNVYNTLAAIVCGRALGLSIPEIKAGLAHPTVTGRRLKIFTRNGLRIIDDTYNASPASVKAALDVLSQMETKGRKIAVLADMLELGAAASQAHYEVGAYAGKGRIDYLLAYGDLAANYAAGFNSITAGKAEYFSNKPDLIRKLKNMAQPGDAILVKGSRGMKMEEVVAVLAEEEALAHE